MSNDEKSNANAIAGFAIGIILVIIACYYAYTNGNAYNKHYWLVVNTSDDRFLTFEDVTNLTVANRNISFKSDNDNYEFHNILGYKKCELSYDGGN